MEDIRYSSNILDKRIVMMKIFLFYITSILFASYGTEAFIGMNWGRQSAQRLVPSQVVDLLLQNGIRNARVYATDEDVLEAFIDSGIDLVVVNFKDSALYDMSISRNWVHNTSKYLKRSNIRQIIIGSYPFSHGINDSSILVNAMESMNNLQEALHQGGYDHITTNMVHYWDMLKLNIKKPSDAEFRDEIKYQLTLFIQHLRSHNASFLVEMFPLQEAEDRNFSMNFAFIDNKSPREAVHDAVSAAVYTNIFEFMYDCYVWALTKMNASDVKVAVTQVGWPTDGREGANAANAERFFKYLLPLVASNKGTPMRPGAPIDIYVHALTDETKMPARFPFTRHWGVYRSNGQPKYKIDLSGRGHDVYPTMIQAIMWMPKRWCVFNGDKRDMSLVKSQLDYACSKGDCSSTTVEGSCSKLSFEQNVSYAFNMVFQFEFQNEETCNFGGLGHVTVTDPSTADCVFPIEVVKGRQQNFAGLKDLIALKD